VILHALWNSLVAVGSAVAAVVGFAFLLLLVGIAVDEIWLVPLRRRRQGAPGVGSSRPRPVAPAHLNGHVRRERERSHR
jgi:hypothetical protein